MKKISILGSTGSIGQNALKVVKHLKDVEVLALAAKSNIDGLYEQALEVKPKLIAVFDLEPAKKLQKRLPQCRIVSGLEGLKEVASLEEVESVIFSMSGSLGIKPCIEAIDKGKKILLANKEVLVSAGRLIMKRALEKKVPVIPIDSEHSALFQCLEGRDPKSIRRLIITASGGPFLKKSIEELKNVSMQEALTHPNWSMGRKITVDSSTMMNKGLEVIEAHHLFQIPLSKIDVVIHPESLIHSMVEFIDGSILAQLSEPSMIFPIQYAITYPERKAGMMPPFDLTKRRDLSFFPRDDEKFPCLKLAFEAAKLGDSATCFLNAANEEIVGRYLNQEFSWIKISEKLKKLLSFHREKDVLDLESIFSIEEKARELARQI